MRSLVKAGYVQLKFHPKNVVFGHLGGLGSQNVLYATIMVALRLVLPLLIVPLPYFFAPLSLVVSFCGQCTPLLYESLESFMMRLKYTVRNCCGVTTQLGKTSSQSKVRTFTPPKDTTLAMALYQSGLHADIVVVERCCGCYILLWQLRTTTGLSKGSLVFPVKFRYGR